jgi:hypothetical protein
VNSSIPFLSVPTNGIASSPDETMPPISPLRRTAWPANATAASAPTNGTDLLSRLTTLIPAQRPTTRDTFMNRI